MVSAMRNIICALVLLALASCSNSNDKTAEQSGVALPAPELKYGLEIQKYDVEPGQVKKGDFFGEIAYFFIFFCLFLRS